MRESTLLVTRWGLTSFAPTHPVRCLTCNLASHNFGNMPDSNINAENPYAAPQVIDRPELPEVQLRPGETPCHHCGGPVTWAMSRCPRCRGWQRLMGRQLLLVILSSAIFTGIAIAGMLHKGEKIHPVGIGIFAAFAAGIWYIVWQLLFWRITRHRLW